MKVVLIDGLNLAWLRREFLTYVKKTKSCWLYTGVKDRLGYGWLSGKLRDLLGAIAATRAAWLLFKGLIPDKHELCHHCDNPSCVRWTGKKHLFTGTRQDNVDDMVSKGRQSKGKKHSKAIKLGLLHTLGQGHHNAKLTDADVTRIFNLYKRKNTTQAKLADMFNTNQARISSIVLCRGRFQWLQNLR